MRRFAIIVWYTLLLALPIGAGVLWLTCRPAREVSWSRISGDWRCEHRVFLVAGPRGMGVKWLRQVNEYYYPELADRPARTRFRTDRGSEAIFGPMRGMTQGYYALYGPGAERTWPNRVRWMEPAGFVLRTRGYQDGEPQPLKRGERSPSPLNEPIGMEEVMVGVPYWIAAIPAVAVFGRRGFRWAVAYRRTHRGRCATCGYDLRGASGPCPECGATSPPAGKENPPTAATA